VNAYALVDTVGQLRRNIAAASECIADGARVIDEQQNRIQRLRDCGEDTTKAERVLQYMESVQARYVATKARLQSMLNGLIRH
jgi:hypothetical protein